MTDTKKSIFVTCPKGLESLLVDEVTKLGALEVKETLAGVRARASLHNIYRICLWSGLANRVLLELASFPANSQTEIYEQVKAIDWPSQFQSSSTFAVHFSGTSPFIDNTQYGAQRVKDGIVDCFREKTGERPGVNRQRPEMRISVHHRISHTSVSLDLSGESLHRRGYTRAGGAAPMKANLARAVLTRAGWPEIADRGGALIDPMCGSGTLLIEAATMALGIAPGIGRPTWGFTHWSDHDPELWASLLAQADRDRTDSLEQPACDIYGYDHDGRAIRTAEQNIIAAGLDRHIRVRVKDVDKLSPPTHKPIVEGLVVTNPPYGERLGEEALLVDTYRLLGQRLREQFVGWHGAVFTANPELAKTMGIRATKQYRLWNGALPARLLLFDITPEHFVKRDSEAPSDVVLNASAQMFANRLRKNEKHLRKWVRRENISCYRLYDADIPEYAVAVDRYGDCVHVAEYQPPASIDERTAATRLRDVLIAIPAVLDVTAEHIFIKHRERQRGNQQYSKQDRSGEYLIVEEGPARFRVNLRDYLDTGLFLDHRKLRHRLSELAAGKSFLNLFAYTATATVFAALGGARSSVSVDLSSVYLSWAKANFQLNNIDEKKHRLQRADVLQWLRENTQRFDVILLDPPTFSNSKRMTESFDVQRDHRTVIDLAMRALTNEGLLIFSTNRRKFSLDKTVSDAYQVKDMTTWSIGEDFTGRRPHRCWFLQAKT